LGSICESGIYKREIKGMLRLSDEELKQFIETIDASLEVFRQTYTEEELKQMEDE
jgi:HPt (histidine-containing phosphotransfer) domain-containing protein